MDFFRSVFSDEADPPKSESVETENKECQEPDPDPPSNQPGSETFGVDGGGVGGWSFGGLIKTLATRSESVIETYRRDLKEFGSGLKKEIEVAQGSLETVSHKIDEIGTNVIKGTAQIISQGKDAILVDGHESDSSDTSNSQYNSTQQSLNSKRYSRFDAQVRAIQGDTSTYCEEPEDLDDYNKFKLGFVLDEKSEEIDGLLEENTSMRSIYEKVVPDTVDRQTFWCRYFFRVHKLKQAEDLRAKLVKRAISREEEEEELSWDVDDEDDDDEGNVAPKLVTAKSRELGSEDDSKVAKNVESSSSNVEKVGSVGEDANVDSKRVSSANTEKIVKEDNPVEEPSGIVDEKEEKSSNLDKGIDGNAVKPSEEKDSKQKVHLEEDSGVSKKDLVSKSDDKVASDGKTDSDVSVVSSQRSMHEEEDLGWDEIEDLSIIDEKKTTHSGSPDRAELRKRLSSAAEDDEDLSWDIEDDDEPTKA
ncbi:hypothetical protein FEM48_Zijuj09G0034300 [Ziziphus jujuba var. spinosa]|uniref:BSD domain-containing protein n=1 Tax=Ziziphus jujuba var. spinosa TaxID=714518 RepID=A0A978UQM3_ZIZJJ|nr:hypothetical protein FEM48_Zijuj09G0034300 [Ziziphus jujuba var. spinosa]